MALDTVAITSGGDVAEPIAIVGCGCKLPGGISTVGGAFRGPSGRAALYYGSAV